MRKRLVRGISSIMGTLLVLSITIALGGLLYMYSQGLFNNLTKSSNVPVTVELYSAGANKAVLHLSVQNPSNQVVQITSVKVMYEGQVIASNNTLSITVPGGNSISTYVILSTSQTIVSGNSYIVALSGTIGNNQFGQVVNVIASG
jgi:flagellin-like protein